MNKVVISGYYGFNNAGDEAVLYAIIKSLQERMPNINITVLSAEPERTTEDYGVRAVDRWKLREIARALKDCDILISGGGSLLQDVTSSNSPLYYLSVILLAKLYRKRVCIFAQGIGPLTISRNRRITSLVFNRVEQITVRDQSSLADLRKMEVKREIEVISDPVLSLNKEEIQPWRGEKILAGYCLDGTKDKKLLGVYIRSWQSNKFLTELARACDILTDKGWQVVFVPMHFPADISIAEETAKLMAGDAVILKERYSPPEMLSLMQKMDVVLGMRLHSLIMAAVVNVPMVGVSYDPKVDRFLAQIGSSAKFSIPEFNGEIAAEAIEQAFNRKDESMPQVEQQVKLANSKIKQAADRICELLKI